VIYSFDQLTRSRAWHGSGFLFQNGKAPLLIHRLSTFGWDLLIYSRLTLQPGGWIAIFK